MKNNRLLLVVFIICGLFVFLGCGGGSSDEGYFPESDIYVTNGRLENDGSFTAETQSGVKVSAGEGTFDNKVEITLKDSPVVNFENNSLLCSGRLIDISGVKKSDNPVIAPTKINSLDKTMTVVIPNPFFKLNNSDEVKSFFVGFRKDETENWRYSIISTNNSQSNPQVITDVRASINSSEFYIRTQNLGQFAIFADLTKSSSSDEKIIIRKMVADAMSATAQEPKTGEIWMEDNLYKENMKVVVAVEGNNFGMLRAADYLVELTYSNNNFEKDTSLAGKNDYYATPAQTSASNNKYVHSVIINDVSGTANEVSFVLNTLGKNSDEFPMSFSVTLRNRLDSFNILPFEYSCIVSVVKSDTPSPSPVPTPVFAPVNVKVSAEKIAYGESMTISWEAGDNAAATTYDVALASDSLEFVMASGLTKTNWTSPAGDEALATGSYYAVVKAKNSIGWASASEKVYFTVVEPLIDSVVIKEMPKVYALKDNVTVVWSEVKDPLGNEITYNLKLTSTEGYKADFSENTASHTFEALDEGNYSLEVTATNGTLESLPAKAEFQIVNSDLAVPKFNDIPEYFKYDDEVKITWEPVTSPVGKVFYDVWFWKDGQTCPQEANAQVFEPEYYPVNLDFGTYYITVAANDGQQPGPSSEIASFAVIIPASASIHVSDESVCNGGFYTQKPVFVIAVTPDTCDEAKLEEAIIVTDNTSSTEIKNLDKIWNDGVLTVGFNQNLEAKHEYTVSMTGLKDRYDCYEVADFTPISFTVAPYSGQGTSENPFVVDIALNPTEPVEDGKLLLIGSVTADLSEISNEFTGISINSGIALSSSAGVESGECHISGSNVIVGVANDAIWPSDSKITFNLIFNGTCNGNIIYFKSSDCILSTESGKNFNLGSGSTTDPYLVYAPGQLDAVRNHLEGNFLQVKDIDLKDYDSEGNDKGKGWLPIGTLENSFIGFYDGNNKKISNLKISGGFYELYGLFGCLGSIEAFLDGEAPKKSVSNLTISEPQIETSNFNHLGCGSLAGLAASAIINNCISENAAVRSYSQKNNLSDWSIDANLGFGILIGSAGGCSISSCKASGVAFGMGNGGILIGASNWCEVAKCQASGKMEASANIGGLIGVAFDNSFVNSCEVSEVSIANGECCGALVGFVYEYSTVSSCKASEVSIANGEYCGALVGAADDYSTVHSCEVSEVSIANGKLCGGLIGIVQGDSNVSSCEVSDTEIVNATYCGGLFEECYESEISDCSVNNVKLAGKFECGGLIDYCANATVYNCKVKKLGIECLADEPNPGNRAGGLVAYCEGSEFGCCSVELDYLYGNCCLGGLAGFNSGVIRNCYVKIEKGKAIGDENAFYSAGIVGYNEGEIYNCYTTCKVFSFDYLGQLAGYSVGYVSSCFSTAYENDYEIPLIGYEDDYSGSDTNYALPNGYDGSLEWYDTWNSSCWNLSVVDSEGVCLPELK